MDNSTENEKAYLVSMQSAVNFDQFVYHYYSNLYMCVVVMVVVEGSIAKPPHRSPMKDA